MALASSTLQDIRQLFRNLTRSPSDNQITDAQIDQYVNTFIAYDMPEHLRLFDLHSSFTFYLTPNVDTYPLTGLPATDPLFNFKNLYVNIDQPVYIGGYLSMYTQEPNVIFQQYPLTMSLKSIGLAGNGLQTTFSGFITNQGTTSGIPAFANRNAPILQSVTTTPVPLTGTPQQYNWGRVLINSVDAFNNVLSMIDFPIPGPYFAPPYLIPGGTIPGIPGMVSTPAGLTTNGNWGILFDPTLGPSNWDGSSFINYITGQFSVQFSSPPATGAAINSQTFPYVPSRPQIMMFYDDMFTFRPVPDQAYPVSFKVYSRPTQLISSGQIPDIEQWWQYISYGAARKLLQARTDMDTLALIEPEYQEQQLLVLRKTIVQNTTQRTNTIYVTTNRMYGYGYGGSQNGF